MKHKMNAHTLNPLSFYKSLHDARGRKEAGAFLVEGVRAVAQIAQARPDSILEIVVAENCDSPPFPGYPARRITASQFRGASASTTPSGLLAVVKIPDDSYSPLLPPNADGRILALEDVQDPGNVGALVRSAAAFDFSGVLLSEKCADPFGPKAVAASAGAVLSVWVRKTPEFLARLRSLADGGHYCVAADIRGTEALRRVNSARLVLIVGNEGGGISQDVLACARSVVKIPINSDKVESLNVAASGAVCMYALTGVRA
jgi:TrmH family RNA methyltransferase